MNETLQTLTTRTSCKSYQDRHVDKSLIDQIVTAGLHAPSGRNQQTPRFVVVTADATVGQLAQLNAAVLGMDGDPFYGARDVVVVLAKKTGTYLYDGSLAMGNLLNAAWALGVGACWIHRAKEVFESQAGKMLLNAWGISEDVEGIGFCVLGYPKTEKHPTDIQAGRVFYAEK